MAGRLPAEGKPWGAGEEPAALLPHFFRAPRGAPALIAGIPRPTIVSRWAALDAGVIVIAIGRRVYGLGAIALGIVELSFGGFAEAWFPVPAALPAYHLLLYAGSGLLILGGLAVNLPRVAGLGAALLALLFAAGLLALQLPNALADPATWVGWQGVAESLAMALGGVVAAAAAGGPGTTRADDVLRAARRAFGLCLLVFGISHFVYARFTAALVPSWLPPSQLFWAYATGACQFAAGLAMLSGIQARLAAILLTIMYGLFGLLVHLPAVIAAPSSHMAWAENCINLILTGAAWSLADSLSRARRG